MTTRKKINENTTVQIIIDTTKDYAVIDNNVTNQYGQGYTSVIISVRNDGTPGSQDCAIKKALKALATII